MAALLSQGNQYLRWLLVVGAMAVIRYSLVSARWQNKVKRFCPSEAANN